MQYPWRSRRSRVSRAKNKHNNNRQTDSRKPLMESFFFITTQQYSTLNIFIIYSFESSPFLFPLLFNGAILNLCITRRGGIINQTMITLLLLPPLLLLLQLRRGCNISSNVIRSLLKTKQLLKVNNKKSAIKNASRNVVLTSNAIKRKCEVIRTTRSTFHLCTDSDGADARCIFLFCYCITW